MQLSPRLSVKAFDRHTGASVRVDEACLWVQIDQEDSMSRLGQPSGQS